MERVCPRTHILAQYNVYVKHEINFKMNNKYCYRAADFTLCKGMRQYCFQFIYIQDRDVPGFDILYFFL